MPRGEQSPGGGDGNSQDCRGATRYSCRYGFMTSKNAIVYDSLSGVYVSLAGLV